jgi:plastocyanin
MTDPGGGSKGGGTGGTNDGGSGGVVTGPPAASLSVTVGNNLFRSDRNGSVNSAVDTVVAGGKVTWTWVGTSSVPHTVQSLGTPSFTSGALETGNGSTYEITFTTPGTYRYNCAVHGNLMTGTVVVTAP